MTIVGSASTVVNSEPASSITVELPPLAELPYSMAALLADAGLSWPHTTRASLEDHGHSLACLTQAIYYEARSESSEGKLAVAQVVINRVGRRGFGRTVCDVVDQTSQGGGCQFSFRCDGSLRAPKDQSAWRSAQRIAETALAGTASAAVGSATYYHNDTVVPEWAHRFRRVTRIGAHIFYSTNA
jgi:spore germination cell wall hydrolase CwlJ-like protein